MPEFTNAFSGLKEDRMLTHNELVRAIRFMIAAEYEAIQLYTQLAESTDNKLAQEVLLTSPMKKRNTPANFSVSSRYWPRMNRGPTMKGWVKPMKKLRNGKDPAKTASVPPARTPIDGDAPPFMVATPGFSHREAGRLNITFSAWTACRI